MAAQGFKFLFFSGKGGVGKTTLACATAVAMADKGKKVLLISTDPASNLQDVLGTPVSDQITPHQDLNLLPYNVVGLKILRAVFDTDPQSKIVAAEFLNLTEAGHLLPDLKALVDELEKNSDSGLIMTMGKGGVGKTVIAASIATMLAYRGHTVLLTTTDPAAHIRDFTNQLTAIPENLTIERIDPKIETKNYIDKIAAQKGQSLDEEGKKLLREDLQSPCTEEVAVFYAFSKVIQSARRRFVVMDTAPTGHTLLLLDTTGSYHREIMKNMAVSPGNITTPYMMLQDNVFAKILLVALPETTPMREAEALQKDLQRAGIVPYAWVINECLSAISDLKDPLLRKRASAEVPIIDHIAAHLSKRTFGIPYLAEEKLLPAILSRYEDAVSGRLNLCPTIKGLY